MLSPMTDQPVRQPAVRRPWLAVGLAGSLMVGLLACGIVWALLARRTPPALPDSAPPASSPLASSIEDQRLRRLVLGTWHDNYQGKRTMTLNEDGSGTMTVELSGISAMLVAPRLHFNLEWSVENGRLRERSLGGQPETQVQMILKTMGDRVDQPILEATADRLLLLDADGKTRYDWRRHPTPPSP